MIYNMVMMNLTDSAKNHFLNFFNGFFKQKEFNDAGIKNIAELNIKKIGNTLIFATQKINVSLIL